MGTFVMHLADLANELGYSIQTVKRLVSDDPARLPPGISLAAPGAKKGKTVFLRSSFETWLQQKEAKPAILAEGPRALDQSQSRARGRPTKSEAIAKRLAAGSAA